MHYAVNTSGDAKHMNSLTCVHSGIVSGQENIVA